MSNTDSAEDEVRGLWKAQDVPALQPLAQQQLAEHAAKLQGTVSRRNRREVIAAESVQVCGRVERGRDVPRHSPSIRKF